MNKWTCSLQLLQKPISQNFLLAKSGQLYTIRILMCSQDLIIVYTRNLQNCWLIKIVDTSWAVTCKIADSSRIVDTFRLWRLHTSKFTSIPGDKNLQNCCFNGLDILMWFWLQFLVVKVDSYRLRIQANYRKILRGRHRVCRKFF